MGDISRDTNRDSDTSFQEKLLLYVINARTENEHT